MWYFEIPVHPIQTREYLLPYSLKVACKFCLEVARSKPELQLLGRFFLRATWPSQ